MYKLKFTIGDWSQDGHNQSTSYNVISNKNRQATREAHFKFKEQFFDIGDICSDYEQYNITDELQIEVLKKLNLWKEGYHKSIERDELVVLWTELLKKIDPELTYKFPEEENEWQDVHFYGFDKDSRHLSTPGYGLYE